MAKNYKLIPGETNNWEVAAFLLIEPRPQNLWVAL